MIPSIASCLCGAVFGDNTSPIADTTVLVTSAVNCPLLLHVSTQLPYAGTVAAISMVGFLVAGFTKGNLLVTLMVSLVLELLVCIFLYFMKTSRRQTPQLPIQNQNEIHTPNVPAENPDNDDESDKVVVNEVVVNDKKSLDNDDEENGEASVSVGI